MEQKEMAEWEKEEFEDSNNNKMKFSRRAGKNYAFELVEKPGSGYITFFEDKEGEWWPGPVNSWFGPGERFETEEEAMAFYENGE